jgi:predicted RNase H-like HicB family nuclease
MNETYERYSMVIEWSEDDQAYIVTVPELPGCQSHGRTYEEAAAQGRDAIASWVAARKASGRPVPPPRVLA